MRGGGRPVQPWHTLCANADCARFVFLLYCFPFCHLQFCGPYPLSSVSLSNYVWRSVHPSSDTPPFNTVPSGSANLRCFFCFFRCSVISSVLSLHFGYLLSARLREKSASAHLWEMKWMKALCLTGCHTQKFAFDF